MSTDDVYTEPMEEHDGPALDADTLLDVGVRVWAEIGRTRMPVADAVALAEGAVVDLDRLHDEPVDLFVNGLHYATGRLVTVEGEWALTIDTVVSDVEVERASSAA
jgi:flagellar motor switch protein FliN/FliY